MLVPMEPRYLDTNQGIVVSDRQTAYSYVLAQDQEPFHLAHPMSPSAFASDQGDSDEPISTEAADAVQQNALIVQVDAPALLSAQREFSIHGASGVSCHATFHRT